MANSIIYPVLDRIVADWFYPHLDIIGVADEAENTIQDDRFLFGCVAGPSADLFNLTHEMAHFIEIDKRRCHYTGWRLKYGTHHYFGNRTWYEMNTTQAVEREIRTLGIQLVLNRHYQFPAQRYNEGKRDSQYMAELNKWIQNWEHYGYINGEFVKDYEDRALTNIENAILAVAASWSLNSIRIAWELKVHYLRQKRNLRSYGRRVQEYA